MDTLQNIFQTEIIQKLGWTLIHFTWQAATIALILAIILKMLHKSSANLRYIIACAALALIVLMPIITINMVEVSTDNTSAPAISTSTETPPTDISTKPVILSEAKDLVLNNKENPGVQKSPLTDHLIEKLHLSLPYIVTSWLIGVFALSLYHLGGWTQLQKLRKQMTKPVTTELKTKLKQLSSPLGITKTIAIMESALVQVPTVVGHLKPIILLPASALTGLDTDQIEAILAHELAHIKRNDYLVNILQTVVEILGFYHPAVWWTSNIIRKERENACDDIAVSLCNDKLSYAKALTTMEQIRATKPALAVAVSGGNLFQRIKRLFPKDQKETKQTPLPSLLAMLLIASLLICICFTMSCSMRTKEKALIADNTIVPGQRISEYTFDMTKEDVLDSLGKPELIFYSDQRYTLDGLPDKYYMVFKNISFLIIDDSIKEITAHGPYYKFANGLKVGDHEDKISETFGSDFHLKKTEWKDFLTYEEKGIVFEIDKKDRTVMEISISPIESSKSHKKAYIPPTSTINEQGHIVDKIDYPFVNDPQVIGTWASVDFVGEMEDFKVGEKQWKGRGGKLFLHEMIFANNGRLISKNAKVSRGYPGTWTKGLVIYNNDTKTASEYTLKDMDGSTYMFYQWKSGDYSFRHSKPSYYVLKKVSSETGGLADRWASQPSDAEFAKQLPAKIEQLDIDTADHEQVKKIFGNPAQYIWSDDTFTEENLPRQFIMVYPSSFRVFMTEDEIVELRHESGFKYIFRDKLRSGSTLQEVFEAIGHPDKTVTGEENRFEDNVLYKDIDGRKGHCYYARTDQNVRLWFLDYKLFAIYMTRSDYNAGGRGKIREKADIPATSTINEKGHIVDKIDYPFVNDQQVIGTWDSVDFVEEMKDFKVGEKKWTYAGGKLFLKKMIFENDGNLISVNGNEPDGFPLTWTKGLVFYDNDFVQASEYLIKEIDGSTYMFYQWKSGDYSVRHSKPSYYVLKKIDTKTSSPQILTNAYILSVPADMPQLKDILSDDKSKAKMITPQKLDQFLEQLKGNPKARVIASPTILTNDGQSAEVTTELDESSESVKLNITNKIQPDKKNILMDIDFEYSTVQNNDMITKTKTETKAIIPSNEAIALSTNPNVNGQIILLLLKPQIQENQSSKTGLVQTQPEKAKVLKQKLGNSVTVHIDKSPENERLVFEILEIKIDPIRQGQNTVRIKVKNTSPQAQVFAVGIQARASDGGWGTTFIDTIEAHQTRWITRGCKLRGTVTDESYIDITTYSPGPAEGFDRKKWVKSKPWDTYFKKVKFPADELEHYTIDQSKVKPASKEHTAEIISTLSQIQQHIKSKEYKSAWQMFTPIFRDAEYQISGFEKFKKCMQVPQRLYTSSYEILSLKPLSVTMYDNTFTLKASMDDKTWTVEFIRDNNQYKLNSLTGPLENDWQKRLLPLMQNRTTKHFDIYYFKDSTAEKQIDQIAEEKDKGFEEVCNFLNADSNQRITMIFFEDGQSKQMATWHQGDGWAFGNTIVEIYNDNQKLDPYHETVHVIMRDFGNPPALFNEGFAVYMSEKLGSHALKSLSGGESTIYQRVRELKNKNEWIPLEELITYTEIGSGKTRPPVAYPQAASFVKFLIDTYGKDKFLKAYKILKNKNNKQTHQKNKEKLKNIYGKPLEELKKQWQKTYMTK